MKTCLFSICINFCLVLNLSAQGKISKIITDRWDDTRNEWVIHSVDAWDYDEEEREILFTHRDDIVSDFHPVNFRSIQSMYDGQGKISQQIRLEEGRDFWRERTIDFIYQDEELVSSISKSVDISSEEPSCIKEVFENNEIENRRTVQRYRSLENPENWMLEYQVDSLFDNNGCLQEQSYTRYEIDGSIINKRKQTFLYSEDCRILLEERWDWNVIGDSLILTRRNNYEYLDIDRITRINYEIYQVNINQWNLRYTVDEEVDEEGRIIRIIQQRLDSEFIDTFILTKTYAQNGEIETSKRYQTRYGVSDDPLYLTQLDSFVYQYEEDRLIKKVNFFRSRFSALQTRTTTYDYYCDGQLKSESLEINSPIQRLTYKYHGGVNCPLEEGDPSILIYPNPTVGDFTIHSNLFFDSKFTIQIFTLLGQEIYFTEIDQPSYQTRIELPQGSKGQFVVVIKNEEARYVEKVMVY